MSFSNSLIQHLQQETGHKLVNHHLSGICGGDINTAYHLKSDDADWFIKTNLASLAPMFAAEAKGLD